MDKHYDRPDRPISRRSWLTSALLLIGSATGLNAAGRSTLTRAKWNERYEAVISFEINQAISRVHRPYLAVYVEDNSGAPVRTIALWVNKSRGEQWIADLRRWFRGERARRQANGGDLVQTMSSATRLAGVYSVTWNGRDDKNQLVDLADYHICIECDRQNGTYQLIRHPLTFGAAPFFATIKGNYEIIGISVDYRMKR